ncbi:MAG: zinc ribbon domain-containing protein [Methanoregula sp.]|jgi:hypothetical protein|nr:zinc ribbon domain-containing protein [Methanoregula sp.]
MGYPELDQDESIILETRNVKFKSISLDAILTNKRIILIDSKKNIIPPQDIPLTSIRIVEMGENAIRDPFLLLILNTITGEKRQMVITFSRQAGAERKRECTEWVKKLESLRPAPVPDFIPAEVPVQEEELIKKPDVSAPSRTVVASTRPVKKKIEIARPLSKIIEKNPVSPKPIETSSLPSGTFCSRCGNRVPLRSTFCNLCGTPIMHVPDKAGEPQPAAPQAQIPFSPPVIPAAERQSRPIEQIIHSIEPLIEDSVPRTQSAPLLQKNTTEQKAGSSVSALPVHESQKESTPQVIWPVLSTAESPLAPAQEPAPAEPESPPPTLNPVPEGSKPNYRTMGIIAIAIIAIIIGIVFLTNITTAPSGGTGDNVTTPAMTTKATTLPTSLPKTPGTPLETPAPGKVMIPPTGVWVRVTYPGTFTGSIGIPGDLRGVNNSGDLFYQVSTTNGIVMVSIQKIDGSSDKLALEIYKNGVMVKQDSTIAPKGVVDIQFDLKTIPSGGANTTITVP